MGLRSCTGLPRVVLARPVVAGAKAVSSFLAFTGEAAGAGAVLDGGAAALCALGGLAADVAARAAWQLERGAHAAAADGSALDPCVGVRRSTLSVAVGGARGALLGELGRQ
jgi:hypothetical protein